MQGYADDLQLFNQCRGLEAAGEGSMSALPPPAPYTAAERAAAARASLSQLALEQQQHLFHKRTQAALQSVVGLFSQYLQQHAVDGRNTWATATDIEVLLFAKDHWVTTHRVRNSSAPAASTLATMLSCLKRAFRARNRTRHWDGTLQSNPVESLLVRDYQTLFALRNKSNGVMEKSAVPLLKSVYLALMDNLADQLHEAASQPSWCYRNYDVLLLARDSAAFALLWHSARRGQDILNVEWPRIACDLDGTPVGELWASSLEESPAPEKLYVLPTRTKTETTQRPQTWVIPRLPPGEERYCAVDRLLQLFRLARAAGVKGFDQGSVFTGFSARTPGVLSASGLAQRLKRVLNRLPESLRLGAGGREYTLHSFRRGRMQHEHGEGMPTTQLMELAGLRTFEVAQRYLDVGRHLF